jgi:hypothetical protein
MSCQHCLNCDCDTIEREQIRGAIRAIAFLTRGQRGALPAAIYGAAFALKMAIPERTMADAARKLGVSRQLIKKNADAFSQWTGLRNLTEEAK